MKKLVLIAAVFMLSAVLSMAQHPIAFPVKMTGKSRIAHIPPPDNQSGIRSTQGDYTVIGTSTKVPPPDDTTGIRTDPPDYVVTGITTKVPPPDDPSGIRTDPPDYVVTGTTTKVPPADDPSGIRTDPPNYVVTGTTTKVPPADDPSGIRGQSRSFEEHQLGTTVYDLQSNYTISSRLYFWPSDGTIGGVWTKGHQPAGSYPDRGTGYNYFNGTEWGPEPAARIENHKTGWPTIAPWGPDGEIVVTHNADNLTISRRPVKGTGEWEFFELVGPPGISLSWPRMCTSGINHDTVHVIANSYDPYLGQRQAILYYRSPDGGATWDIEHMIIDGMGSDYYSEIFNDCYAWAEPRGNTIAFVVGFSFADLFVMKSLDAGDNWEKIIAWEHPYPMWDWQTTITDTFFTVDNSAACALDPEGKVHVAFGITRVKHDSPGETWDVFYLYDGIGYWNEDMDMLSADIYALSPPQYNFSRSEMIENYNYVGWTQDVDGSGEIEFINDDIFHNYGACGLSTHPTMTIDEQGRIFIAYASTTETYSNMEFNYKHIWARAWDEEAGWTTFIDLTADVVHMLDECFYPVLAANSDDYIHLMYNADAFPGIAVQDDHAAVENRTVYVKVNKFEFYPWAIEDKEDLSGDFRVSQNYPNPFNHSTRITVELPSASILRLEVTDLAGKAVAAYDQGYLSKGTYTITVDATNLVEGIYFYTVYAGARKCAKKMIVL